MDELVFPTSIFVDAHWLRKHLHHPRLRVVDGTWVLPGNDEPKTRGFIPNAVNFDLGALKEITPPGQALPPSKFITDFSAKANIEQHDVTVVYDRLGLFSAPRVAWSLMSAGYHAFVLDGGLPAWINIGAPTYDNPFLPDGQAPAAPRGSLVKAVDMKQVVDALYTHTQIIDARSPGRFAGTEPEPRAGLRSGHIPGSINLPLGELKTASGRLKSLPELRGIIASKKINLSRPIFSTCGSGVTASALDLIFFHLGAHDHAVYSGSWAEYGASDHPIETGH